MLYAPLVIGLASGRRPPAALEALLLVLAATAAFLAQAVARALPRRGSPERARYVAWAVIYGLVAIVAGLTLIVRYRHHELLVLVALAAAVFLLDMTHLRRAHDGSKAPRAAREILAAAAFALAAPGAAVIARGRFDRVGWALWLFSTLFFTSSIITVRAWIDGGRIARRQEAGRLVGAAESASRPRPGGRTLVLYHVALATFIAGAVIGRGGGAALWWAAAFLPPIARAFHARAVALRFHPALKTVGWMELGWTVLFTVTMIVAMSRTGG